MADWPLLYKASFKLHLNPEIVSSHPEGRADKGSKLVGRIQGQSFEVYESAHFCIHN